MTYQKTLKDSLRLKNNMKLAPIAHSVLLKACTKLVLESAQGTAGAVKNKLFALGNDLKKDGEDVTDDEVQAALLSALIDADGKVDSLDVSDVEAIKQEIKESRSYLKEDAGILHTIEMVGTLLGNTAFLHVLTEGLHKVGFANVDENKLKANLERIVKLLKSVTGFPAKAMEKAFAWIAKKLGSSVFGQKVAGMAGTLVVTVILLSLAIYLFPSVSSGVLMIFGISGMMGKSVEIIKIIKELIHHVGEHMEKSAEPAPTA